MIRKVVKAIVGSATLIASVLSVTSFASQMVLAAINCDPAITVCHGGFGYGAGGAGGRAEIGDSAFTQSGGGGSEFLPGGGGGHTVSDFDPEHLVHSGGNSDTGGGRSVCDVDPNTGSFVCQTTGKP